MSYIHADISNLVIGKSYIDVYLVKTHSVRTSSKNKPYLDITLVDRTGEINGKLWNMEGINPDRIIDSDFIMVSFQVEEYNGNKQMRINKIGPVAPDVEFDKSKIIPTSPEAPEALFDEIRGTAAGFKNSDLKKLTINILDERKEAMLKMPAAKSVHHSYIGGLLQHTAGMLRTAKAIVPVYPCINAEILYAGVILHDICKIDEFQTGPVGIVSDYTAKGKLMGHLHMGAAYIENKCRELSIGDEISMIISHMILSHHGEPDFGAVVRPATLEATLLNIIDLMDSRVAIYSDVMGSMEPGTFSQRVFLLNNVMVYKPNIQAGTQDADFLPDNDFPQEDAFNSEEDFFA